MPVASFETPSKVGIIKVEKFTLLMETVLEESRGKLNDEDLEDSEEEDDVVPEVDKIEALARTLSVGRGLLIKHLATIF